MIPANLHIERIAERRPANGLHRGGGRNAHFHQPPARGGGAGELKDFCGLTQRELIERHEMT